MHSSFAAPKLPVDEIEDGCSILLTGEDTDALKTVFSRLVAADEDERSIVLATNSGGRAVQRTLNEARDGAGSRASILTAQGPARGDHVSVIDDIGDLTQIGMQFSNLVAASQQSATRFRSGIFLCSTITSEVDDTRSVYRFINSNFLTDLRRGDGIGVVAFDRTVDINTDVDSVIKGMGISFSASVEVEKTGRNKATVDFSEISEGDGTTDVPL
jgi:hypothetical protein